jgi:hypothetical protein
MRTVILALVVCAPVTASAQTSAWTASGGVESFTFRDVARSRPPIDGSSVAWRGSGPTLSVTYDRAQPFRLRRIEITASSNGNFGYETGVGVTSRPGSEAARFFSGSYDYRRYFNRRLLIDGLQAGFGVRGLGERRMLRHDYTGVEVTEREISGTIAWVAEARFRRANRFSLSAELSDGATILHGTQRHVSDVTLDNPGFGGGWLTDFVARADVRVTARAGLKLTYRRKGEARLFNHRSYADARQQFLVGLTYGR